MSLLEQRDPFQTIEPNLAVAPRIARHEFCMSNHVYRVIAQEAAVALGFTRMDAASDFLRSYQGTDKLISKVGDLLLPNQTSPTDQCDKLAALPIGTDSAAPWSSGRVDSFPSVRILEKDREILVSMGFGSLTPDRKEFADVAEWEAEYIHCRAVSSQINSLIEFASSILTTAAPPSENANVPAVNASTTQKACALIRALHEKDFATEGEARLPKTMKHDIGVFAKSLGRFFEEISVALKGQWHTVYAWAMCVAEDGKNGIDEQAVRGAYYMYKKQDAPIGTHRPVTECAMLWRKQWPSTFDPPADTDAVAATQKAQVEQKIDQLWSAAALESDVIATEERVPNIGPLSAEGKLPAVQRVDQDKTPQAEALSSLLSSIKTHATPRTETQGVVATTSAIPPLPSTTVNKRKGSKLFAALKESNQTNVMPKKVAHRQITGPSPLVASGKNRGGSPSQHMPYYRRSAHPHAPHGGSARHPIPYPDDRNQLAAIHNKTYVSGGTADKWAYIPAALGVLVTALVSVSSSLG